MIEGRTATGYDDFFARDPQPRIWKTIEDVAGEQGQVKANRYFGMPPCGHRFAFNERHVVDEHPHGTFSVRPQATPPTGHNSILCRVCGWHGYVYDNHWSSL